MCSLFLDRLGCPKTKNRPEYIILKTLARFLARHVNREIVRNSSSRPYPASGLARIFPTLVVHSCYYSLVKINIIIRTSYFNRL